MATLEKYKFYSDIISGYTSKRFGILKFSGFAIFLALLGTTEIMDWEKLGINYLFLFTSLFVFRLIDDLGSFYIDRIIHPERTYLRPEKIKIFIVFTLLSFALYLVVLLLLSTFLAHTIFLLTLVSFVLYFAFFKVKWIMKIIPLIKYPVFIWSVLGFSMANEVLFLSAGAFFMVFTSDFIDENPVIMKQFSLKLLLLILTGIFIFQPEFSGGGLISDIVYLIIPLLLIVFPPIKGYAFYPIIVFPILHIIDLIN